MFVYSKKNLYISKTSIFFQNALTVFVKKTLKKSICVCESQFFSQSYLSKFFKYKNGPYAIH